MSTSTSITTTTTTPGSSISIEKETQAHNSLRRRNWSRSIVLYDQILGTDIVHVDSAPTKLTESKIVSVSSSAKYLKLPKERRIQCLLGRCECQLELGKYENCVNDARHVLKMFADDQLKYIDCASSIAKVKRRLLLSLYKLKRYQVKFQIYSLLLCKN